MRISSLMLIVFITACSPQETKSILTEEQKNIDIEVAKQLVQGIFDDVWGGLDSTKILDYHTSEFVILEQGQIWKNKEIRDYIRRSLKNEDIPKRINKMDYISTKHMGEAIYLDYHNYATFERADSVVGKAQWLESAIAIKTGDGWRLDKMHSTYVKTK